LGRGEGWRGRRLEEVVVVELEVRLEPEPEGYCRREERE